MDEPYAKSTQCDEFPAEKLICHYPRCPKVLTDTGKGGELITESAKRLVGSLIDYKCTEPGKVLWLVWVDVGVFHFCEWHSHEPYSTCHSLHTWNLGTLEHQTFDPFVKIDKHNVINNVMHKMRHTKCDTQNVTHNVTHIM